MAGEWYRAIPAQTAERTVTNTAEYNAAYAASANGAHDRIKMQAGNYDLVYTHSKSGIQVICEGHVKVTGGIYVTGDDNWFVGMELTDPDFTATNLFGAIGKNNSFINCWSHHAGADFVSSVGDFGADGGGGTLVYGCVMHDSRHVVYVQNKSTNPTKYYAHNFISRALIDHEGQGEYCVHLYSSDKLKVRNVHFLENIISEGQVLVGASDAGVSYGSRWEGNWFDQANWRGTYNNPGEITFKDNHMYKVFAGTSRMIDIDDLHGAGEAFEGPPRYPQITTITGNLIYNAGSVDSINAEAKYLDSGGTLHYGTGALRADDVVDDNDYYGVLRNTIKANGVGKFTTSLATWQSNTAGYGNQWDTHSTLTATVPPDYYTVIQNEYDADRAMLFAWGDGATVTVTLPRIGDVYDVYDQWGTPLFTGDTEYDVDTDGVAFIGIVKYTAPDPTNLAVPEADTNNDNAWKNQADSTTNIYAAIDDGDVASDTDYIKSPLLVTNSSYVTKLTEKANVNKIYVRYAKDTTGGDDVGLDVYLFEGYVDPDNKGTQIATGTFTVTSTSFTTSTIVFDANDVGDFDDLFIELVPFKVAE